MSRAAGRGRPSGLRRPLPRLEVRLPVLNFVPLAFLTVLGSAASSRCLLVVKLARSSGDMGTGDVGDLLGFVQLRAEARPRSSDASLDLPRLSLLPWRPRDESRVHS